jgi:7 transmembrane receptor (rhodopsin family)
MNATDISIGVNNISVAYFNNAAADQTISPNFSDTGKLVLPANRPAFWTPVTVTTIAICAIGITGNLFSCVVIARYPPLRKRVTNYFIVNQCFADLIVAIMLALNTSLEYYLRSVSGSSLYAACYLIYSRFVYTSVFVASIWNLAALAIERYLKIVHAVRHKTAVTQTKIVGACVAVWILGFVYRGVSTLPVVSVRESVCRVPVFRNAADKMAFGLWIFLGDFFLPMSVIGICYVLLTRKLRKAKVTTTGSMSSGVRRNIIRLLLVVSIAFVITVGPRQIMALYYTRCRYCARVLYAQFSVCQH